MNALLRPKAVQRTDSSDTPVEDSRLHESYLNLFQRLGHPVLAERCLDLLQMRMAMVTISPMRELADHTLVVTHGLAAAGATGLAQKHFISSIA